MDCTRPIETGTVLLALFITVVIFWVVVWIAKRTI